MNGVITNGLAGVRGGLQQLERVADDVARGNSRVTSGATADSATSSLVEPMGEQIQARQGVESSARVIAAADATLGRLIDIRV